MFGHRLIIIIAICAIITFESTISSVIHQPQTDHHDELKLVFLFHRHGERTPYLLYPNDPYKKIITETVGIGQLIEKGKQRLYRLGEYLSQRYYNDNGDRFSIKQKSPRKVYARSSGSERCLQSITLLLAGMFPPEGEWKWNDNLGSLWQPFAIQTVPFEHDTLLNPDYECPVADHLSNEIYNSEEAENISQNYRNLFKKLANYTRYQSDEMDIVKASYIYDIILSESNFDLPPPEWLDDEMWNGMKILNDYVFSFNSSSRRIQRFRCGSMFGEIFQQLNVHFGNDSSQSKNNLHQIYIYSTHDEWLAQFLSAMKVYNNIPPSFGATVMLEVYQHSPNDEPYFKGFYLNATETQHVYPLQFPDCTEPCTLSKFHQSIKDLIIEDPEKILKHECYIDIKKCL